jgi:glutaryl-CoA dehydrogenase
LFCALDYVKARKQFSRPLAGYRMVQNKLVNMLTEITKGQLVCLRLGQMKDAGTMRPNVSFAKRNSVQAALDIARRRATCWRQWHRERVPGDPAC